MPFLIIYIITLFIAPQLWIEPFVGLRVDWYLYPSWFLYLLISGKLTRLRFGSQEKFFIFWIIWICVSLLANGVFFERWDTTVLFYVKWFVLYLLIVASLNTTDKIFYFVCLIVSFSIILGIEGIHHYQNGIGWAGQALGWSSGEKGRTQWINIFDGPGVFCVVYTISFPFLLPLVEKSSRFLVRIFGVIFICLFAIAIFVNGSRGGMITAFGIVVAHFGERYYKKNKFLLIVFAIGIIGMITVLPSYMTDMADSRHSSSHRVEMWAEGCEMVKQNPVFGIGKGGFAKYTGSLMAHNSFVEIMGETGVIGLFAWVGLIYFSLKKLYIIITNADVINTGIRKRDKILARTLFISIGGYLLSAMFVTLEYETLYLLLGVCAAFGLNLVQPIVSNWTDIRNICCIVFGWLIFINGFTLFLGPGAFR